MVKKRRTIDIYANIGGKEGMVARAHFPPFDSVDKKEEVEVDPPIGGKSGRVYLNGWYTPQQLQNIINAMKGSDTHGTT